MVHYHYKVKYEYDGVLVRMESDDSAIANPCRRTKVCGMISYNMDEVFVVRVPRIFRAILLLLLL
jgi:hypothetical protein